MTAVQTKHLQLWHGNPVSPSAPAAGNREARAGVPLTLVTRETADAFTVEKATALQPFARCRIEIVLGMIELAVDEWAAADIGDGAVSRLRWLRESFLPEARAALINGQPLETLGARSVVRMLFLAPETRILGANLNSLLMELE